MAGGLEVSNVPQTYKQWITQNIFELYTANQTQKCVDCSNNWISKEKYSENLIFGKKV